MFHKKIRSFALKCLLQLEILFLLSDIVPADRQHRLFNFHICNVTRNTYKLSEAHAAHYVVILRIAFYCDFLCEKYSESWNLLNTPRIYIDNKQLRETNASVH